MGLGSLRDVFDAPSRKLGEAFGAEDEMSMISDPLDIYGERSGAAFNSAAQQQIRAFQEALKILKEQNRQGVIQTYGARKAGERGLEYLNKSSGIKGLDAVLSEIMGTEAFSDLRDERTDSIQGMLSAGGLMRSGEAIEEGAAIPTDIALMLHQLLSDDATNLARIGQTGVGQMLATGDNYARAAGEYTSLIGNAGADATLGQYQTQQNNIGTAGGILAKIFGAGG